jgi:hypothetical protein
MSDITAIIEINETDASDIISSLVEMEIEDDHRLTATFKIKLAINRTGGGTWIYLDDERLKLWNKISIKLNIKGEETELMKGYITQIKPHIEIEENNCCLIVMGMDGSCLMSVEEAIKDWPNKTDSDIANEILQSYAFTPQVDTVDVVHDEAVATIIQRESDIRFLKRLARRNGFECFIKGDKGFFRRPVFTDPPQPVLAAHFGAETNLMSFEASLHALRPTRVEMHQIDTIAKEVVDANLEAGDQLQLGRDGALSIVVPSGKTSKMFVKQTVATGQPEMENLCTALLDEAEWFLQGRGEINTVVYGSVLQTRSLVPIKGVGEPFSGLYYVTNVKHNFTVGNYVQKFCVRRNALAPTGPSDFGGSSLLGGPP